MADLSDYKEATGDLSPSSATISLNNASASVPFFLLGASGDEVVDQIPKILGATLNVNYDPNNTYYKVQRQVPMAHALFWPLYAEQIVIHGIGVGLEQASSAPPQVESMPGYANYENWQLDIKFAQRPYAILEDDDVEINTLSWFPPPPDADLPVSLTYAKEWIRYTSFDLFPQNDNVSGVQGQSLFQTQSTAEPHGKQFQGMPRIFLPNQVVTFSWYQVPLRYILSPNSYLEKYKGRINQFAWYEYGSGHMFSAGSLLYMGWKPKIYSSPVAQLMNWQTGDLTTWKYADIELYFLVTKRTGVDVPTTTARANYLAKGHNLNPYFPTRLFYYTVYNSALNANQAPYWFSVPFEILWTDPDSFQDDPQP